MNILFLILKSARPRQWIKNLALFAPLLFSGLFFAYPSPEQSPFFITVCMGFVIFSLLTSGVYIMNDILDKEADANHPFKKKRAIASGQLPVSIAKAAAAGLFVLTLFLTLLQPRFFQLLVLSYFGLQVLYAKILKHIPILDVSSIATGFLIRVYAGAVIVNLHMSVWFLLTVISASLFLAVGKRQSERTLMINLPDSIMGSTRKILTRYSQRLLDQYTGMFANATWLTYAIYTFQNEHVRPDASLGTYYTILPLAFRSEKLLMLTVPFVIFGIMRYLQLIYEKNEGESPDKVLLSDVPLLSTVFGFGTSVMVIIYVLS